MLNTLSDSQLALNNYDYVKEKLTPCGPRPKERGYKETDSGSIIWNVLIIDSTPDIQYMPNKYWMNGQEK